MGSDRLSMLHLNSIDGAKESRYLEMWRLSEVTEKQPTTAVGNTGVRGSDVAYLLINFWILLWTIDAFLRSGQKRFHHGAVITAAWEGSGVQAPVESVTF